MDQSHQNQPSSKAVVKQLHEQFPALKVMFKKYPDKIVVHGEVLTRLTKGISIEIIDEKIFEPNNTRRVCPCNHLAGAGFCSVLISLVAAKPTILNFLYEVSVAFSWQLCECSQKQALFTALFLAAIPKMVV
jgi:hypothetical protein